jgi:regulation of enolase protein 1 (concanavalin A-like superfamily)
VKDYHPAFPFEEESMDRLASVLILSLAACATLATPAPRSFEGGWDRPIDPDRDCDFVRADATLTIKVPGTEHDLAPERRRLNAPRLMRDVEGDFDVQVRVGGDFRPSAGSSVAAGLLLALPDGIHIRFEYGARRLGEEVQPYAAVRQLDAGRTPLNCTWDGGWRLWPLEAGARQAYLRLQRRGDLLRAFLGPDGERWTQLLPFGRRLPARLKVGLAAYSTSKEPFAPRFEWFKLVKGKARP